MKNPEKDEERALYLFSAAIGNGRISINKFDYLFLEVTNCIFISISKKVEYLMLYVVFLQVVHQVGSITLQRNSRRSDSGCAGVAEGK